jgi:arsenate reductase
VRRPRASAFFYTRGWLEQDCATVHHIAQRHAGRTVEMAKSKAVAIYGIKNCDTMKKARTWLDGRDVAYVFHDYKAAGIERGQLEAWSKIVGWELLLNKAGTTFRALPEKDKDGLTEKKAIALMVAQPSMIKRPVLDVDGKLLVGFKTDQYEKMFGK